MEFHLEALNCLCRLCGGHLSKYSYNKLELSRKIEKVLSIDVSFDERSIHPPRLCDKCRRLLQKYNKEIQTHKRIKTNSFPDITWAPHSEVCEICKNHAQPDVCESNSFISKCSDMFVKYGYMRTKSQENVMLSYVKVISGAEKIHSCVKVFKDRTFSVTVLGRHVENSLIVDESKVSSPDILSKILEFLHTAKLCKGSTGFSDLFSSSTRVFENNGNPVAYVEAGYSTETTIRHKDCQLFFQEANVAGMCYMCSIFKSNLFRHRRRKSDSSGTGTHANSPNIFLSGPELLQKLRTVKQENRSLKRKLNLTNRMLSDEIEKNGIVLDDEFANSFKTIVEKKQDEVCQTFAPGSPQQLLWSQQTQALRSSKYAMRWHPTFLRWCISLYGKSPSAYKMVRGSKFLLLPHESTLQDYTNYLKVSPGINVGILKDISAETDETFRQNVTIIFDEIKIKSNLVYSKSSGKLKGFTECGDINDVIKDFVNNKIAEHDDDLATHIIAFMVRGIFSPLKQVFAYYPCRGFTAHQLYWSVWGAVAALESGGFRVRALVSDGASPNRKFYRLHADMTDGRRPTYYTVNRFAPERRLYFVCDVPHLIKTTRNNLENSNWNKKTRRLKLNGEPLEWTKLVELLKIDLQGEGFRLLPKLTYEHLHLNPSLRMKVKLAAQVLSSSVSKALLVMRQQNVAELSKFIANIDQFFDCLNVSTISQGNLHPTRKPYTSDDDWRLLWLEKDFLGFLDDWESECLQEAGLTMAERRRMCLSRETLEGLRITVKSFVSLTKDLLQVNGVEYILSEKFCQDPVEEFFGKVRGFHGHNNHPTVQQFESALAHITILKGKDMLATTRGNITRSEQDATIIDTSLPKRFEPYVDNPDDNYQSHLNTALFYCSSYQYIILAIVLSKGKPYRKPVYTNYWFLGNILVCTALTIWINVYPVEGLSSFLELKPPPDVPYRLLFLATAAINLILCLLLEMFVLDSKLISVTCQQKVDNCLPHSIPEYEVVAKEISTNSRWPPAHFDSGGLSGLFHRLDSAFQSFSNPGERDGDTDSLIDSGSEVESLSEKPMNLEHDYRKAATQANGATPKDVNVSMDRKRGHTNVVFNLNDEAESSREGRISVRF